MVGVIGAGDRIEPGDALRARNPDGAGAHGDVVGARRRRDEEDLAGDGIDLAGLGAADGDPHGVLGDRRTTSRPRS